jgi:transcriptional regulator with PAS, ATPase and Fis domain
MGLYEKNEIIINGLNIIKNSNIEFLINLIDNLAVGVLLINLDEIVLFVNRKYTEITGVNYDDIILKKISSVRPGAQLGNVVKTGNEKYNLPRIEGNKKYFVDLALIKFNGEKIGGITIMKDYEDAKIMSDQLKFFENKFKEMENTIQSKFNAKYTFDDIIGESKIIKNTINLAKKIAISDSSVLITGNTGVGKELFAQSIHNYSNRNKKPFIDVNCATIPLSLIESELFGYTSGSFSGANKGGKIGLFELAKGGTIFLDEVENMSLDLQTKLLRVLQENRIRKIGANNYIDIDARVIAATNIDLEVLIKENKFREDLYYRLCVLPINIPDLKFRDGDVRLLVDYFLKNYNIKKHTNIVVSNEVYSIFDQYDWPGNIRELQNTIEYMANIVENSVIGIDELPNKMKHVKLNYNDNVKLKDLAKEYEKNVISKYINKYGSSVKDKRNIADLLGISIASLYNKMREYNLL